MKQLDMTQILVALISAIAMIVSTYFAYKTHTAPPEPLPQNNKSKNQVKKQLPQWYSKYGRSIIWKILSAVFFIAFIVSLLLPMTKHTDVRITFPSNQAYVEQTETIEGTSQNISKRDVIWIVVFSQAVGRFYPQNNPAEIEMKGDWSSLVYFGVAVDSGKKFDILAITANQTVQNAFNSYLSTAKNKSNWPGLIQLPTDAKIYDRITVTRK